MLTLFRNNPGAMKAYLVPGNTGRFLGFLKSFVNALVEPFLVFYLFFAIYSLESDKRIVRV